MNTTANSLLGITVATPTPTKAQHWSKDLLRSLRRIVVVARYELLLQRRSIALWLLIVLCIGLGGIYVGLGAASLQQTEPYMAYTFENGLAEFLLPFIFMNMFARDTRRKTQTLLWSRPLASTEYALGKSIAAILLGLFASLFPLLVGWAMMASINHTLTAGPLLTILPVLVVSTILVTLFSLLCLALIPRPLLGALVATGVVLYINAFSPKSLLEIVNLHAETAFYSPSIGFGPDSDLVRLQTVFMGLLALLFLGLVPLIYMRRERRGIAPTKQWLPLLIPILLGIVLLVPTVSSFQNAIATFDDLGPVPANPISATMSNYHLQVRADPVAAHIDGTATFTLTPQSSGGTTIYLALNPKLQVQQVTIDHNTSLSFQISPDHLGWIQLEMGNTRFAQGTAIQLHIAYSGELAISRANYAQYYVGFLGGGDSNIDNDYNLSYLGQGLAFLAGNGASWYPLPWTEQTLSSGFRPPLDEVQLNFPASVQVFSAIGSPQRSADGQWWTIVAQPHAPLPAATVAAIADAKQMTLAGTTLSYRGLTPDTDTLTFYTALAKQLTTQELLFHPSHPSSHWNMIVTPLIHAPLIGPGVAFVPEQPSFFYEYGISDSPRAQLRSAGQKIAEAWWANEVPPAFLYFPDRNFSQMGQMHLRPHGTMALGQGLQNLVTLALTNYGAGVTTDQLLNHNFLQKEIDICQSYHDHVLRKGTYHGEDAAFESSMRNMLALGASCDDASIVLYRLGQRFGFTQINQFIQQQVAQLEQYHQVLHLRPFFEQLGSVLHYDVLQDYTAYSCPNTTNDTHPHSCFPDENEQPLQGGQP